MLAYSRYPRAIITPDTGNKFSIHPNDIGINNVIHPSDSRLQAPQHRIGSKRKLPTYSSRVSSRRPQEQSLVQRHSVELGRSARVSADRGWLIQIGSLLESSTQLRPRLRMIFR
jgi:hypothetical protein